MKSEFHTHNTTTNNQHTTQPPPTHNRHYVTRWKTAPRITDEDERLLDEMYNLARRLEDRVTTVERIVAADNPDFRPGMADYRSQPDYRLDAPSQRRN